MAIAFTDWMGSDLSSNMANGADDHLLLHSAGMTTVDEIKVTLRQTTQFDSNHSYYTNFTYYLYIKTIDGEKLYFDKVPQTITGLESNSSAPHGTAVIGGALRLNDGQELYIRFTGITATGLVAATHESTFLNNILCTTEVSSKETLSSTATINGSLVDGLVGRGSPFTANPNTTQTYTPVGQGASFPEVNVNDLPGYFDIGGLQVSDAGFNAAISSRRNLPVDIEIASNPFDSKGILLGVKYSPPAPIGHFESVLDLYSVDPLSGMRRDHAKNVMIKSGWDNEYQFTLTNPVYLKPYERVYITIHRYAYDTAAENYSLGAGRSFKGGDFTYSPENGWAPSMHATVIEIPERGTS
tara:strand:- start:272 stop:1336 length:1065 start_codon:yes stop_codon:yes gene_type:complete